MDCRLKVTPPEADNREPSAGRGMTSRRADRPADGLRGHARERRNPCAQAGPTGDQAGRCPDIATLSRDGSEPKRETTARLPACRAGHPWKSWHGGLRL